MLYQVSDIVKYVRKVLEFNNESAALVVVDDIDTLALNEVVESKIISAAKYITQNAAVVLCGKGKPLSDNLLSWDNEEGVGTGYLLLPEDFWRLLTFQMTDWETQGAVITDEDPEYELQHSIHPGLRGNPEVPVVALCHYPEGLTLELYSCEAGKDAHIKRASYMPIPAIEEGFIELPEKLYEAIVYYAAYMVALSYSSVSVANALLAEAKVMAGISEPSAAAESDQQ